MFLLTELNNRLIINIGNTLSTHNPKAHLQTMSNESLIFYNSMLYGLRKYIRTIG